MSKQAFPWQNALLWLCIIGLSQRGREKRSFCTFSKIKVKRTELGRHTGSCLVSALRGWVSGSVLLSMQDSRAIFCRIGRRYTSGRLAGIIPCFIEPVLLSQALSYLVSINKQTFTECLPDVGPAEGGNLTNKSPPSPNPHINVLLHRFDPLVQKIRWRRKWQPTPRYSYLGNPMDRGALRATVHTGW